MSRVSMRRLFAERTSARASLEAVSKDGIERELVFFGRMLDVADLENATRYEDHEQWRAKVPCKEEGREITVRIRKTTRYTNHRNGEVSPKDPEYHLCIKSFIKGESGNIECESEVPSEAGEKLLNIFREEGDGMVKRRYFFPVGKGYFPGNDEKVAVRLKFKEDTCWEVDVFFLPDGEFAPYVKLDLEMTQWSILPSKDGFDLPFPIRMDDVVYSQPHERSPEDAKRVEDIMARYMKAKS